MSIQLPNATSGEPSIWLRPLGFAASLARAVGEALETVRTHRHSVARLMKYDFQQRYAGSLFGRVWWVLNPILFLVCYSLVYLYVYKINIGRLGTLDYVLYLFSGFVVYQLFVEGLGAGAIAVLQNRSLLLNSVFPAELLPLRAVLNSQIPGLIGLALTIPMSLALGRGNLAMVSIIPVLFSMMLLLVGIGYFLAPITLIVRDIPEILRFVNILLLIVSPISFFVSDVPGALKILVYANPLAHYMMPVQAALVFGEWPSGQTMIFMFLVGAGLFVSGLIFLSRVKAVLSDYAN